MEINKNHIPLDKSWIIRMGVLDMIHQKKDIQNFLSKQKDLSEDLLALKRAAGQWGKQRTIDIGESGTLFRFLQFASWKLNLNKKFLKHKTLKNRGMANDSKIVGYSLSKLLTLDHGTSQWASAAVLLGDTLMSKKPPFKLKLTYDALKHWNTHKPWQPRADKTIQKQAEIFLKLLQGKKAKFVPKQAEDFCFAYTFGYISKKEAEKKWPALEGHESNRFIEMDEALSQARFGEPVTSKDHRVIQAVVMWSAVSRKDIIVKYPKAVNKSWPQFWEFINSVGLDFISKTRDDRGK